MNQLAGAYDHAVENLNPRVRPLPINRVQKPCPLRDHGRAGQGRAGHGFKYKRTTPLENLEHGSHDGWYYLIPKYVLEVYKEMFACHKFGGKTTI